MWNFLHKVRPDSKAKTTATRYRLVPLERRAGGDLPFGPGHLSPRPDDWQVGPPDFVGIAYGKAGTTWWYRLLLDHPAVTPNRREVKELNYFYAFGYHGISAEAIDIYHHAFARPGGCLCGEWSPAYLAHPLALDYLARAAPRAKLLAIVRNPIDRVISNINQEYAGPSHGLDLEGDRKYLFQTFSLFPRAIFFSLFGPHFQHLFKLFDPSQVLVLQYERCKISPASEIAKTYRFLGIDDTFEPPHLHERANARPYVVPKLSEAERLILAEYFEDDVRAFVKQFPQIDLDLWGDFRTGA